MKYNFFYQEKPQTKLPINLKNFFLQIGNFSQLFLDFSNTILTKSIVRLFLGFFTKRGDPCDLGGSEQSRKVHSDLVHPRGETIFFLISLDKMLFKNSLCRTLAHILSIQPLPTLHARRTPKL